MKKDNLSKEDALRFLKEACDLITEASVSGKISEQALAASGLEGWRIVVGSRLLLAGRR